MDEVSSFIQRLSNLSLHEGENNVHLKRRWAHERKEAARIITDLAAENAELRRSLRLIKEQDVIEIALDPDWPRRIAAAAPKSKMD